MWEETSQGRLMGTHLAPLPGKLPVKALHTLAMLSSLKHPFKEIRFMQGCLAGGLE